MLLEAIMTSLGCACLVLAGVSIGRMSRDTPTALHSQSPRVRLLAELFLAERADSNSKDQIIRLLQYEMQHERETETKLLTDGSNAC